MPLIALGTLLAALSYPLWERSERLLSVGAPPGYSQAGPAATGITATGLATAEVALLEVLGG